MISYIKNWIIGWPFYYFYNKSENRAVIDEDLEKYTTYEHISGSKFNQLVTVLRKSKPFRNIFYYRIGHGAGLLCKILKAEPTFSLAGDIKGGLVAFHPFSTIVNAKSIGRNFTCRQCTVIGNKSDDKKSYKPVLGDNVTLGANVVIIGDISIGDNVIIGAGSVVTKDIPSNSIVAGNPAKVIKYI